MRPMLFSSPASARRPSRAAACRTARRARPAWNSRRGKTTRTRQGVAEASRPPPSPINGAARQSGSARFLSYQNSSHGAPGEGSDSHKRDLTAAAGSPWLATIGKRWSMMWQWLSNKRVGRQVDRQQPWPASYSMTVKTSFCIRAAPRARGPVQLSGGRARRPGRRRQPAHARARSPRRSSPHRAASSARRAGHCARRAACRAAGSRHRHRPRPRCAPEA